MTKGQSSECDIIMKGGITSGVVYPKAILRMAEQYRFRSVGGTSAGAIAAALTAAAEYNRADGGFSIIEALPEELQTKLLTLFQPAPQFRSLFGCALLFIGGRPLAGVFRLLSGTWPYLLAPLVIGLSLTGAAVFFGNYLAALLLALISAVIAIPAWILAIAKSALCDLNASDFGFCPGTTQPGETDPGLSDWLAEKIEITAGRMQNGQRPKAPLTFSDLWVGRDRSGSGEQRSVDLRMMTTNLSLRRPNALPEMDRNHYFKADEFCRLFPEWVVEYLKSAAAEDTPADLMALGYHALPIGGDMPVIVAARMSLSFPILFSAIPLYRRDFPHQKDGGPPVLQRMLFSDGGLSSNFPVHFFDALLPKRPTFGISLDALDKREARSLADESSRWRLAGLDNH